MCNLGIDILNILIYWQIYSYNLSNLKSEVDKLDVDKLVPVPDDLSKLSDGVNVMLLK